MLQPLVGSGFQSLGVQQGFDVVEQRVVGPGHRASKQPFLDEGSRGAQGLVPGFLFQLDVLSGVVGFHRSTPSC